MDSITQAALGASVAAVVAGRHCKPKTLLAGAALGTLPDLDVLISYGDPISDTVKHRGFSHSLFVLLPFSLLFTALWYRFRLTVLSFSRLWFLIAACLITHPLLDSFTTYGTQLFWPLDVSVAISSIFIIDPLYTLPLLVMLTASLMWREKMAKLCGIGLLMSSLYLVWSVAAYSIINQRVHDEVKDTPLANKPIFISPTPFNTVLWRIIILDDNKYYEGFSSLLDSKKNGNYPMQWAQRERGYWQLEQTSEHVNDLVKFSSNFIQYQIIDDQLVVTDLRLGLIEYLPFRFVVAKRSPQKDWQLVTPIKIEERKVKPKHLPALWLRLLGNQDVNADLCHINECPNLTVTKK
ncbi:MULTISPECIES: metal-dependent hydrolase [unclassified Photobacterium]|uniref:metal-dependent hydrolase n=1 Tax=unclassified Photobacterium TaxID=2628852 RepID=UPI001EE0996D|nr:metal-dependent hydrolase [Photobacterium sp. Ph6]MCG3874613.1 metal-dependent hydrolase [Photobacterium sp. Ph5]